MERWQATISARRFRVPAVGTGPLARSAVKRHGTILPGEVGARSVLCPEAWWHPPAGEAPHEGRSATRLAKGGSDAVDLRPHVDGRVACDP